MVSPSLLASCRYYFYNEGASVSVVLKNAGIVDIDQVRGQVEDSKSQVVSGLTGTFKWRWVIAATACTCWGPKRS